MVIRMQVIRRRTRGHPASQPIGRRHKALPGEARVQVRGLHAGRSGARDAPIAFTRVPSPVDHRSPLLAVPPAVPALVSAHAVRYARGFGRAGPATFLMSQTVWEKGRPAAEGTGRFELPRWPVADLERGLSPVLADHVERQFDELNQPYRHQLVGRLGSRSNSNDVAGHAA